MHNILYCCEMQYNNVKIILIATDNPIDISKYVNLILLYETSVISILYNVQAYHFQHFRN